MKKLISLDRLHIQCVTLIVSCALSLPATTRYVSLDGGHVSPFTTWANAATNIQAAVDVSVDGDVVLVTNGVYASGTRVTPGYVALNRLVITNDITVQSVNGPEVTIIRGEGPLGDDAVRGVYLSAGTLIGFTITNGHTRAAGHATYDRSGGGVNMAGGDGGISNCILIANSAVFGGGARGGTVYNSVISGNTTEWDGAGTYATTVHNSFFTRNNAGRFGGGFHIGTLYNCLVEGNNADIVGGGTIHGQINNSTVVNNTAGSHGGGVAYTETRNSIVWNNSAVSNANHVGATFLYSCTTPLPAGAGNISTDPLFVDAASGNYRLLAISPCINAGTNALAALPYDLDGNPRILLDIVDMGAYEYIPEPFFGGIALLVGFALLRKVQQH